MTESEKKKITSLRNLGLGYKKIAEQAGLSRDAVCSFLKRIGVECNTADDTKCLLCGKALVNTPHRKKKKFCTDECRRRWWARNSSLLNHKRRQECLFCGEVFSSDRSRKFCSIKCYLSYRFGGVL